MQGLKCHFILMSGKSHKIGGGGTSRHDHKCLLVRGVKHQTKQTNKLSIRYDHQLSLRKVCDYSSSLSIHCGYPSSGR